MKKFNQDSFFQQLQRRSTVIFLSFILFTSIISLIGMGILATKWRNSQIQFWLQELPRTVSPNLLEGDHIPIKGKLNMITRANLFSNLAIFDNEKVLIAWEGDKATLDTLSLYPITDEVGRNLGYYVYKVNSRYLLKPFLFSLCFLGFVFLLAFWIFRLVFSRVVGKDISSFHLFIEELERIGAFAISDQPLKGGSLIPSEEGKRLRSLVERLINLAKEQNKKALEADLEAKKDKILWQLAAQVAHDIRSPVTALEVASRNLENIDPDVKQLLINAIARVREIASDLLGKYKTNEDHIETSYVNTEEYETDISKAMNELYLEKKTQFKDDKNIHLELICSPSSSEARVNISPSHLKRTISNLINNSIEAAREGSLVVKLTLDRLLDAHGNEWCEIKLIDNGKGMTSDVLAQVLAGSVSVGKIGNSQSGYGLGLSGARRVVSEANGIFEIKSEVNRGTVILIHLPILGKK